MLELEEMTDNFTIQPPEITNATGNNDSTSDESKYLSQNQQQK